VLPQILTQACGDVRPHPRLCLPAGGAGDGPRGACFRGGI